jgi:UDP-N-acetylmuramoylalanine--D-glutamate ligase
MDVRLLQTKKVSVIGAARSGVAVAKLLKAHGASVFVSDSASVETLQSSVADLLSDAIPYEIGGHSNRVYECDLMIISPGVPNDAAVVQEAQKRKIMIVSELEAGSWFCRAPMVAITGSNGKTTTTTLIGRILADATRIHVVAGNIGTAFSSVVSGLYETDVAVLEVSSFQLDFIEEFRPKISVLLNITPDHMDRYDHSMEKYAASKARVFKNQKADDVLIYNEDDPWTKTVAQQARCCTVGFSVLQKLDEGASVKDGRLVITLGGVRTDVIEINQIFIKGMHNLYNSMAAVLVGQLLGVEVASMQSTLKTFEGVEHRLEFVRTINDVRYYNDSKATNVDSVWYALQSFKEPIVLFLGGRDKGNDYSKLKDLVHRQVKAIVAIGESADKVEESFKGSTVIKKASSMEDAVGVARFLAQPGDVVLLSPACASFDWFKNYEHRGQVFKELVNKL